MKVKDLIALLEKLDAEAEIYYYDDEYDMGRPVTKVKMRSVKYDFKLHEDEMGLTIQ